MYMVNDIFTSSRYKEIIMVQPNPSAGLKGKPHQHALTFMPSCIQKSKAWVPRPKSCFSIYPNFCKLSPHPKNGNHTCTNPINKQHFTEHLVGALLATNSKGTGAMWLAPSFQNTT